eukprot:480818-Pelagomonas_calceolata.AAC.1
MRIWRVGCHASGHPDSSPPALLLHAPSKPSPTPAGPGRSPLEMKCRSGVNNSCKSLDSMATQLARGYKGLQWWPTARDSG